VPLSGYNSIVKETNTFMPRAGLYTAPRDWARLVAEIVFFVSTIRSSNRRFSEDNTGYSQRHRTLQRVLLCVPVLCIARRHVIL